MKYQVQTHFFGVSMKIQPFLLKKTEKMIFRFS
jgi:hypothetical protein